MVLVMVVVVVAVVVVVVVIAVEAAVGGGGGGAGVPFWIMRVVVLVADMASVRGSSAWLGRWPLLCLHTSLYTAHYPALAPDPKP